MRRAGVALMVLLAVVALVACQGGGQPGVAINGWIWPTTEPARASHDHIGGRGAVRSPGRAPGDLDRVWDRVQARR